MITARHRGGQCRRGCEVGKEGLNVALEEVALFADGDRGRRCDTRSRRLGEARRADRGL